MRACVCACDVYSTQGVCVGVCVGGWVCMFHALAMYALPKDRYSLAELH